MKPRIAMISEHASPLGALGGVDAGGQNVYVGQLASHLARDGYEVDVFTRRDNPALPEIVDWLRGVRVVNVPAGPARFLPKEEMLPCMGEFTTYMRDNWSRLGGYDLIHANFWMSGLVAAELKRAMAVPFVITFHALGRVRRLHQKDADRFPDERFAVEERVVAEADCVIAESPQDRVDLLSLYGADESRISIVPCGFDPEELAPMSRKVARDVLCMEQDMPVVLQLGRLVPRKGVDNVIRALARLRRHYGLDARLLVVGGESDEPDPEKTPEIGRLQLLAQAEGICDLVSFEGRKGREELRLHYGAADVFVTTPWYEPFGMTPLEAMACARPVVGAEVGGIKYSVAHGATGFLVQPNDPDELAQRLAWLIEHPAEASAMGRRGLQRVHENFTWARVSEQIASVYSQVGTGGARTSTRSFIAEVEAVRDSFDESIDALVASRDRLGPAVVEAARTIAQAFADGGKLLICGNGGSAADSQHFAAELVGRFQDQDRGALPAIALTSDTAVLTAWANDACFDDVFARQVEALGRAGDVVVGISTSGRSANVIRAFEAARRRGMHCVALTGRDGGDLASLSDTTIVVPACDTQRIQEVHSLVIHLVCQLVEQSLTAAVDGREEQRERVVIASPRRSGRRSKVHAA